MFWVLIVYDLFWFYCMHPRELVKLSFPSQASCCSNKCQGFKNEVSRETLRCIRPCDFESLKVDPPWISSHKLLPHDTLIEYKYEHDPHKREELVIRPLPHHRQFPWTGGPDWPSNLATYHISIILTGGVMTCPRIHAIGTTRRFPLETRGIRWWPHLGPPRPPLYEGNWFASHVLWLRQRRS